MPLANASRAHISRGLTRASCLPPLAQEVLEKLKTKGIAIRVASPKLVMEEAPESYKDVTQARACHSPLLLH